MLLIIRSFITYHKFIGLKEIQKEDNAWKEDKKKTNHCQTGTDLRDILTSGKYTVSNILCYWMIENR